MRVEIQHRCSSKYIALLRLYCGMSAFIALCASVSLGMWERTELSFAAAAVCALMCCAAVVVPLSFGRISYLRSGGCIKIEKGLLNRHALIINRSDIRGTVIKRGFAQRKLGLCTVVFFTGSGKVRLRGIEIADGRLLDRMLRPEGA
jgi:Bacterial membrane flanked domain.